MPCNSTRVTAVRNLRQRFGERRCFVAGYLLGQAGHRM